MADVIGERCEGVGARSAAADLLQCNMNYLRVDSEGVHAPLSSPSLVSKTRAT